LGEGDLTLFIKGETMKISYSKEFLETFTGTQEELDDLTAQIQAAIEQGNITPLDDDDDAYPILTETLH
jgi:hypothetical protein